jgi:hypothetical protein
MEVRLRVPGGIVSRIVDLSQPPERRAEIWKPDVDESFAAYYVDAYSALNSLSYIIDNFDFGSPRRDSDSERALRDFERSLTKTELGIVRNILGRTYDRIAVRSTFMGADINDRFYVPFISAVLGSKEYDNTSMSQGELWVHYVSWFLEREIDAGNLALLDEPESFLTARGQRPFIDSIAHQALRRGKHSGPRLLSCGG